MEPRVGAMLLDRGSPAEASHAPGLPYVFLPALARGSRGRMTQCVQDTLRAAIVRLAFRPGEFIHKDAICQRLGVEDAPPARGPSMGLVRYMIRRPIWLLGFLIMGLGYASQAVALHLGSLNVVQPLMISELVILVLVLWLWYSSPLRPRDFVSAIAAALGLGGFLVLSAPTDGTKVPSNALWLVVGASVILAVALLSLSARGGPPWRRAMLRPEILRSPIRLPAWRWCASGRHFGLGMDLRKQTRPAPLR